MVGNAQPGIADDAHRNRVTKGDAVDLLLHRAGVRVDQDADRRQNTASAAVPII